MKKALIYILFPLLGIFTILFFGVGMHGHFMFRPHMLQDWIFAFIVIICFLVPILYYRRRK
jgi:hypothetical protein